MSAEGGGGPSGAPAIESVRGGLTPSHQENFQN